LEKVPVRNINLLDPRAAASNVINERWRVNENLKRR